MTLIFCCFNFPLASITFLITVCCHIQPPPLITCQFYNVGFYTNTFFCLFTLWSCVALSKHLINLKTKLELSHSQHTDELVILQHEIWHDVTFRVWQKWLHICHFSASSDLSLKVWRVICIPSMNDITFLWNIYGLLSESSSWSAYVVTCLQCTPL